MKLVCGGIIKREHHSFMTRNRDVYFTVGDKVSIGACRGAKRCVRFEDCKKPYFYRDESDNPYIVHKAIILQILEGNFVLCRVTSSVTGKVFDSPIVVSSLFLWKREEPRESIVRV